MLLHAFYTWLIAYLLYPLLLFGYTLLSGGEISFSPGSDMIWVYVDMLITVLPYSLPGLLAGWACLGMIARAGFPARTSFWVWLTMDVILTSLGAALVLGFNRITETEKLLLILPGAMAVGIAILLRYRPFKKLVQSRTDPYTLRGMI